MGSYLVEEFEHFVIGEEDAAFADGGADEVFSICAVNVDEAAESVAIAAFVEPFLHALESEDAGSDGVGFVG